MPTTSPSLSPVSPYRLAVPLLALYRSTQFYLRFTVQHTVLSQLDLRLLQVSEWRVLNTLTQVLTLSVVTHTVLIPWNITSQKSRNTRQLSQYASQLPSYSLTHSSNAHFSTFTLSCSRTLWLTQAQFTQTHFTQLVCIQLCAITRLCHNTSLWILQLSALTITTQRVRHHHKVMQTQVSSQCPSHKNHSTQPQCHNTTQLLVCFLLQHTLYSFLEILQVDRLAIPDNSHSTYYNLLITQTHSLAHTQKYMHYQNSLLPTWHK